MSCGDSNTCAQETLHTQGSSLSCNTISQFSAKRHQKEPLCIFNWLKSSESFCSHHSSHCSTHRVPVQTHTHTQFGKKNKTGVGGGGWGGGKGTIIKLFQAQCKSSARLKGPLKNSWNCRQMSTPSIFVCVQCLDTASVTFPFLSFTPENKHIPSFSQDTSRVREHVSQSGLLSTLRGQENSRDRLCIIPLSVYGLRGVWGRLLPNDHPPKIQRKVASGFGTPCSPIRWWGRKTGGGWRKKQTSRNPQCCAFSAPVTICSTREWKAPLGYSSSLQGVWPCTETTSWSGECKGELQPASASHPDRRAQQQRSASNPVSLCCTEAKIKSSRKHLKLIKQAGFVLFRATETCHIFILILQPQQLLYILYPEE